MSFLWFLIAVIFFIAWLSARSGDKKEPTSDSYSQGYWDGYRAFGDKVSELLHTDAISRHKLQRLVDEGNGVVRNATDEPESRAEEVGIIPEGTDDYDDEPLQQVSYAAETIAPQPVLTEEELAAEKERGTLQNLNMLLYVGSFLIVAASAIFVTLVMPAAVKLFCLIFVTVAFYGTGLLLHANSPRLRPAATAFVGTGLAILPFVGFALTSLGGLSGEAAWLITSIVGLGAYGVAAVRLQSELVSYLTMAFVLSLALSAVSTLGLAMVWYFIVVIGVSLLCNSLHILYPKLLPQVFTEPVERTGQVTTPVALLASLFTAQHMDLFMYEVLYGAATAHYLVIWLEKRTLLYETSVRILAYVTLLIVAFDVSGMHVAGANADTYRWFGIWWLVLAALQVVYSLLRVQKSDGESFKLEQAWIAVAIGAMFIGMTFWQILADQTAVYSAISLTVIGLTALGATLRLRQAAWAYVGLVASVLLPYVIGRGVIEPVISYEVLAGGFTIFALFALMGLERAKSLGKSESVINLLSISTAVYALLVALSGALSESEVTIGWTTLLTAGLFIALSYLLKTAAVEVLGAVFGVASVVAWVNVSSVDAQWQHVAIATVATGLLVAGAWAHHFNSERSRRNGLLGLGALVFASVVFVVFDNVDEAVIRTATALLLAAGVAAMGVRLVLSAVRRGTLTQISQLAYIGYPLLALLTAWQASEGWVALAFIVYTGILWLSSYVEKIPGVLLAGNVALICGINAIWYWLEFDQSWQLHGVAWLSAIVFYATYWLMVDKQDSWRQWASLISVWIVLGFAAVGYIWDGDLQWVLASVGSLLAIAVTLGIHGYLNKKYDLIEIALYLATFGLQRMVAVLIPETNLVVYGHWWAIVIALVAWWRKGDYKTRLMVALAFVTGSTGIYALVGIPGYSLMFLIEHIIILTLGAMLRQQWAMWWGIVAVVMAVLYFLRGFTFLALLFLGFLLILFVIWRLTKMGKK